MVPIGDFGTALNVLKNGGVVCRRGWNGKGMSLALQVPDNHSKMTQPYIYISTAQGDLVPWLASQADVLAIDWMIVSDAEPAKPERRTRKPKAQPEPEAAAAV